jgi:hypothetical protein
MVQLSTLRNIRIAIFTLSVAIPLGIGIYIYLQENKVIEGPHVIPVEEEDEMGSDVEVKKKEVDRDEEVEVPSVDLKQVDRPDVEEIPKMPSSVLSPRIGRYTYYSLQSVDNRLIEVQVLYVTDAKVYIRRKDKRIFTVDISLFHADSLSVVMEWSRLYADLVTPEQRAYIASYNKDSSEEDIIAEPGTSIVVEGSVSDDFLTGPYAKGLDPPFEWQLVQELSDEFEGDRIDENKWQLEPVGNGWNWMGRPPGLFLPKNVTLEDGKLTVTVSKLPKPRVIQDREYLYQGAIIRSLKEGKPGWYFECKMKANKTEMSSTFWLMTKGNTVKKLETDIQECVGVVSPDSAPWTDGWDRIYHSNLIHRVNRHNPTEVKNQRGYPLTTPNHKKFYVYGAWWKSESEVLFYLDGEHIYTLFPDVDWDVPAFIHMAIETYDWNPVPARNSHVESAPLKDRQTQYEWVRVWRPEGLGD